MTSKIVYLMRGLPGCGKSHMANRLAGTDGVVLETDEYFYTQVGDDDQAYDFDKELLPAAREWNIERFHEALTQNIFPIVIDRGNGLNAETREFAVLGIEFGYEVKLAEPDSPWWQDLAVLLKYREFVADELFDQWAEALAAKASTGHRVPALTIRRWMSHWKHDATVEEILDCTDNSTRHAN
jgi:MoxR-like ATPase